MSEEKKRILISGAGPAGLAFALGLRNSSHSITIVDKKPRATVSLLKEDTRMIALSKGSLYFLESIGLWGALSSYATPIKQVDVSEKGFDTSVLMSASEHKLDNFGALVPLGQMVIALLELLDQCDNIQYLSETAVTQFQADHKSNQAFCTLTNSEGETNHNCDWVISAEGAESFLRFQAGIETYTNDYDQIAVIARGAFEKEHHNIAYERFSSDGPLALLPIDEKEMAIILIASRDRYDYWVNAGEEQYISEVINRFGHSLGDLNNITERHAWKLSLMIPKQLCTDNLILIGNSAHALHPIAGQGLNLGFRDVELLLPYFAGETIPSLHDLQRFERERKRDIYKVVGATDFLVRAFDLDCFPLPHLRNIALRGVKHLPFMKHCIARFGMGL